MGNRRGRTDEVLRLQVSTQKPMHYQDFQGPMLRKQKRLEALCPTGVPLDNVSHGGGVKVLR